MTIVFDNAELIPQAWSDSLASVRVFNPSILGDAEGWLLAYRVVGEPKLDRRIAICRLDRDFRVVADSAAPLSDWIRFHEGHAYPGPVISWFADPRLYLLRGRLFVYWNSGWHEPQNHQFLQELNPTTLRPLGFPRELRLQTAPRQKLEKNWSFFEDNDGLYAVYSVNPHRILSFTLSGTGPLEFTNLALPEPNSGGFAQRHGGLRGGAPPQHVNGRFYSFCHSIEDAKDGYRYVASVYRFDDTRPFRPTDMPLRPLAIDLPSTARRKLPKLNPAVSNVVYPAGAAFLENRWIISCGIDDERCAIVIVEQNNVLETLAPIESNRSLERL